MFPPKIDNVYCVHVQGGSAMKFIFPADPCALPSSSLQNKPVPNSQFELHPPSSSQKSTLDVKNVEFELLTVVQVFGIDIPDVTAVYQVPEFLLSR